MGGRASAATRLGPLWWSEMPGSVTSMFSEPDEFETALRKEGALGLLVTGRGQFRARLTQIALHRLL
jgi:hypothetical protein